MDPAQRPLSPHLQIYKPQLTSLLSILHRVSGIYLSFGILALCFWLISIGSTDNCFVAMTSFYNSFLGMTFFAAWVFAFFYHFFNGIRHLVWDIGRGYDLESVYRGGWMVLVFTVVASLFTLSFFS